MAGCAEAQAEELLALQAIFGDDCHVDSEVPGEVAFSLLIGVDLGLGKEGIKLTAEAQDGAEEAVPRNAGNFSREVDALDEGSVALQRGSSKSLVVEMAVQRILGQAKKAPVAPPLERSQSGRRVESLAAVKHLPPLKLQLSLPPEYPDEAPPQFHIESSWLAADQLSQLCAELDARAAEMAGLQVIFTWAELLRGETAELLGLGSTITLSTAREVEEMRAVSECVDPISSILELLRYDKQKELELWRLQQHCCSICFSEKPGQQFVHLGCLHTFCAECVGEMARLHVAEGSIVELRCPQPDCREEIAAAALERVLDEEAYERWLRLKIQQVMSSEMDDVVFCPRCEEDGVEAPTLAETPGSPEEAPVAECRRCSFMFCGKCLGVAHARVADCIPEEERLLQSMMRREEQRALTFAERRKQQRALKGNIAEVRHGDSIFVDTSGYLTADCGPMHEGDEVMSVCSGTKDAQETRLWVRDQHDPELLEAALEKRPIVVRFRTPNARAQTERMRKKHVFEELMSLRALKRDSQICPRCSVRINRSQGCNHMRCTNCGTHFCYRCGHAIPSDNPYSHFSSSGCTTFDTGEVRRMVVEQRHGGVDRELEDLRREFGHQEDLLAHFQARRANGGRALPPRQRRQGDSLCPLCRHWNMRAGQLNHVRCQTCHSSYCFVCKKRIVGVVTQHFRGEGACLQHGDPPA